MEAAPSRFTYCVRQDKWVEWSRNRTKSEGTRLVRQAKSGTGTRPSLVLIGLASKPPQAVPVRQQMETPESSDRDVGRYKMVGALEELRQRLEERPRQLERLRGEGAKVVGYFPGNYVPEELIYASGAIPICLIHGGNPGVVEASLTVIPRFLCAFTKAQVGQWLLKEQPYYNTVDMLVAPITCQQLRRAGDLAQYYTGKDVFRLGIPHEYDNDGSVEYYAMMLSMLKQRLERLTGNKVTDTKLRAAIALYNRMRRLFREISLLRQAAEPPLRGSDFIKVNHASFYSDPSFMVESLSRWHRELVSQAKPASKRGVRLMLLGPNLAYGDYAILEQIEHAGGSIVTEELCEGIRYYWRDIAPEGDPMIALSRGYLRERLPCAFMRMSAQKRFDFASNLAKEYGVAGAIWYQLRYCETYDIESYLFTKKMRDVGLPMLKLEAEYDISEQRQMTDLVEVFIRGIGERRQS